MDNKFKDELMIYSMLARRNARSQKWKLFLSLKSIFESDELHKDNRCKLEDLEFTKKKMRFSPKKLVSTYYDD